MADEDAKKIHRFFARRGEDFILWTMRFEALLESKEFLNIIMSDPEEKGTLDALSSEVKLKASKARMYLLQGSGDKPLRSIAGERKNPYMMYCKLRDRFATQNDASRVQLQTELHRRKYSEDKTMSEYIDEIEAVFSRLEAMDSAVSESMQIAILLASFGNISDSPYGPLISAFQTMRDEDLTWEKATARLLQEYATREANESNGSASNETSEKAMKTMSTVQCYKCDKFGHYKRDCRRRRSTRVSGDGRREYAMVSRSLGKKKNKSFNKKHVTASSAQSYNCVKSSPDNHASIDISTCHGSSDGHQDYAMILRDVRRMKLKKFILNSGATSHMVNSSSLAIGFRRISPRPIALGDGRHVEALRVGHLEISVPNSASTHLQVILKDVLFVPVLDCCLISCPVLARDGYEISFGNFGCRLHKNGGGSLMCPMNENNRLYEIEGTAHPIRIEAVHKVTEGQKNAVKVWHNRFGHIDQRRIQSMASQKAVKGLDLTIKPDVGVDCIPCTEEKMTRLSLKSRIVAAYEPGEVIYSDICGPLSVPSMGGKRFFVTFTDRYSAFRFVEVLKKKSDNKEAFIKISKVV